LPKRNIDRLVIQILFDFLKEKYMFPVIQNNKEHGEGMDFGTFITRFDDIVSTHMETGRAKAFAFIFYDFYNENLWRILTDGYQDLDRLSGKDLTIFDFNSTSREDIRNFNNVAANPYIIKEPLTLPCVVFFKVIDREVSEVQIVHLFENRLFSLFDELVKVISKYIDNIEKPKVSSARTSDINVKKIATEQFFKVIFDNIYKSFIP
jgi:hypothetical protein